MCINREHDKSSAPGWTLCNHMGLFNPQEGSLYDQRWVVTAILCKMSIFHIFTHKSCPESFVESEERWRGEWVWVPGLFETLRN